jgi:apolipoprotein N-acyltransferase
MRILIQRPLYASALVLVLASLAGAHPLSRAPVNWFGRDTHYGPAASGSAEALTRFFVLQELIDQARYVPVGSITLYPELLVGDWRQATDQLWRQRAEELAARNATLVIGAQVPLADGRYDNALVTVGAQGGQQLIQRLPVPISMWRPFLNSGARAHLTMTGVYALRGKRVAVLICYEQLLVWPVLVSMAFSPDLILAASNAWWARETSIPGIQKTALRAWSRLFNIPVVSAFNR